MKEIELKDLIDNVLSYNPEAVEEVKKAIIKKIEKRIIHDN